MTGNISESVQIDFRPDEKYREQVINESYLSGWIETTALVDDIYIYGGEDTSAEGLGNTIVLDFLRSVEPVLDHTQHLIEFPDGSTWLALYPRDDDSIEVAKRIVLKWARERAELNEVETACPVTKQAWIEAVLEAAQTFHDTVLDLNPALEDHETMEEIRAEIERVEQLSQQIDE